MSQPSKNYPDSRSRKITSTSLHQEYQPSQNAWRPGKINATDPEEIETVTLLKNVRAVLNKLTPQNYHTMLDQFRGFKIDSRDRLKRVIDLIFDKAVREPAFVKQYAGFCSELANIKVTEKDEEGNSVDVKFNSLLIEKCQKTFYQKMYSDITDLDARIAEIDECTDPEKKKELEEILDDDKRISRKNSVGNIKLIAELYKLSMLNTKIMFSCFETLLGHEHEDYIECLCALITNIGSMLSERSKGKNDALKRFDSIFNKLDSIQKEEVEFEVSSRIRFMILDLLDLRKNNWVPRRKTEGPKTIAQIHEDMEKQTRLKNEEMRRKKMNCM